LYSGADGEVGKNTINGHEIAAKSSHQMKAGDRFRLETPGGGGWGTKDSTDKKAD
jgi:N-methylhydantoinase B/oxoprolinase/acetone carboxylase alpha subunit